MDQPLTTSRIDELEGVRALLALWVLVFHVFAIGGFDVPRALDGGHAVGVFFALSGFVIARLLHRGRERYRVFIARRLLRLYPAYAICVGASIALVELGLMPRRFDEAATSLHVLLHATMLHGALPEALAPGASGAFLNPAWSVSVEWQFYLLVPLFFATYWRRPAAAFVGLVAFAALAHRLVGPLGLGAGSVLANASLFTYGILACAVTAVLGLVTLPVSLALSLWMYRYIEAPCMRFGRRLLLS